MDARDDDLPPSSPPPPRRRGHPATNDQPLPADKAEFALAMERFTRTHGMRYPPYSVMLDVAYSLGWRKTAVTEG